jgi:enediyne biosynthesis protein E4
MKHFLRSTPLAFAAALVLVSSLVGQGIASRGVTAAKRDAASGRPWHAMFVDISRQAGLTHPAIYGAERNITYLLETSSGGVALFDYDNDGLLDIFIVVGTRLDGPVAGATNRLYRNRGNGSFEDTTDKAGLRRQGWASGVSVGDFDNDGYLDLFVTYYGANALYRNNGDGTFTDVAADASLLLSRDGPPYWSSGATFIDFDRDGHLDLFVANYVDFDPQRTPKPGENANCNWKGVPVACGPRGLKPARHWLFRNNGDGSFTDVSDAAGISQHRECFGMTAVAADLDDDGWTDLYVACDSTLSLYFRNNGDGTFSEEALERGIALNDDGMEQAGMGVALGDYNLDGKLDLFKTHFADDTHILYRGEGEGHFSDVTLRSGLAVETRYVGWGAGMEDFDNDGWPDLFLVTGNVYPETEAQLPGYPYRSPRLLFRNLGTGKFEQIVEQAGAPLSDVYSSRGAAFGDFDNDGDVDIVIWNRNEPPTLLRNDLRTAREKQGGNWISVRLEGTVSNRAAVGARITVRYGGKVQVREVLSQSSFYSANDPRQHFGLGAAETVDLEIRWPNGQVQHLPKVKAGQFLRVKEPATARDDG